MTIIKIESIRFWLKNTLCNIKLKLGTLKAHHIKWIPFLSTTLSPFFEQSLLWCLPVRLLCTYGHILWLIWPKFIASQWVFSPLHRISLADFLPSIIYKVFLTIFQPKSSTKPRRAAEEGNRTSQVLPSWAHQNFFQSRYFNWKLLP